MSVKEVCLSSAVVVSPVMIWSDIVHIASAFFPALAAFMYKAAASISIAITSIFAHSADASSGGRHIAVVSVKRIT